jgi:hypothetical protein
MSTKENAVPVVVPVATNTPSHAATAQLRLQEVRHMREVIPYFTIPELPTETKRMANAASVPADFVELTTVAIANHQAALWRADALTPEQIRELVSYANSYGPLADEFEALAHFIRHSVRAARYKVGSEALTTYAFAQRLAKRPQSAELAPHVDDMRRALGRTASAEALVRRAVRKAAKLTPAAPPASTTEQS